MLADRSGDANVLAQQHSWVYCVSSQMQKTPACHYCGDVRRAIARTGDAHLLVALRLHFARAEASRYSPRKDRERHLSAANDLLKEFSERLAQGRVHLGLSIAKYLIGDLERAVEEAKLAIRSASLSGHCRYMNGLASLIYRMHCKHKAHLRQRSTQSTACWRNVPMTSKSLSLSWILWRIS